MKKTWILFFVSLFLLALPFSVSAAAPKVIDDAGLLTDTEQSLLEQKAQALSDTYQMDVVIVTVWSLNGKSSEAYADDYFDSNGYGIGRDNSGVLLLLSMEYRDWAISTCGDTIYALTDYGIQSVFEDISGFLSAGQYYSAFDRYLDQLNVYFNAYSQGEPVDGYKQPYDGPGSYAPGSCDDVVYYEKEKPVATGVLISLAIGAAAGGIGVSVLRGQMKTAVRQSGAMGYVQDGTYAMNQQQDVFLYQNVSRIRRVQSSSRSSGGGGSGGSRTHSSSSGRRHGGGHGKF